MNVELTYLQNNKWRVDEDFTVEGVIVPKGFETDLASTPRFLWSLFPPFGKYLRASVVHDYLYTYRVVDRKTADDTFLVIMKVDKVDVPVSYLFYLVVRVFGFLRY